MTWMKMNLSVAATLALLTAVNAQEPATPPPADKASAAVTVNGRAISQDELNTRIDKVLATQTGGQQLPEALAAQLRDQVRSQVLESIIENSLLDAEVQKEGITATDSSLIADLKMRMENHFIRQNMTQAEFEEVLKQQNLTLDQFLAERSQDPQFKELYLQTQLIEKRFPDDVKITDEEIKARYERDLTKVYSVPEQVQASHILISVDESATEEQRNEAKVKITEILVEAKKPQADFAALAGEHSSCPSSAKGGDLGFFPREGAMVEPFAAAAFALDKGSISEVVETRFGYHIIMVTEKKAPVVVALDRAKGPIAQELRNEKLSATRAKYLKTLRESATITYPS